MNNVYICVKIVADSRLTEILHIFRRFNVLYPFRQLLRRERVTSGC